MRRHLLIAGAVWIILTIILEAAVPPFERTLPAVGAREGEVVDAAFRLLLILGIPVFTFVVAVVLYAVLAFRSRGEPLEDGPPVRSPGLVGPLWLLITGGLAILVIVTPGLSGLQALHTSNHDPGAMVIQVEGRQWLWRITYPDYGLTTLNELVVPVNKPITFEVTSIDVVHSFWVPAWRMKIDAVPGLITRVHVTPNAIGDTTTEPMLRLQCAELCGISHGLMVARVSVTDQAGFEAWVAEQRARQR